jgi:N-acetylmuramoyl-L-alanine amidase
MGRRLLAVVLVSVTVTACSTALPVADPAPLSPATGATTTSSTATVPSPLTSIEQAPHATDSPSTVLDSTSTVPTTTLPPATTVGPEAPLAGRVVVLDPGHKGQNHAYPDEINRLVDIGNGTKACNTTGTATVDGYPEARFNWEVALLARTALEQLGATVVMTRQDNDGWGPCIDERARTGNEAGAAVVISIHADGGPESGRGFHVIYPKSVAGLTDDIAGEAARLARALHDSMRATEMPVADYIGENGFSVRDDLGGLNLSDVPAVFLEAGNMRNAADAALLTDPEHQGAIADAIGRSVVEFLAAEP